MMRQNPSALRSFALYLGNNLVAERDIGSSNTLRYQHTDVLGSVIAESNSAGTITSSSVYQPFGERIGGQKVGVGFTGHLEDTEIGLTYMQQRYYDPVIGRFYSNDPVGFSADKPMMFNRYAYANNNPYKYTDPDGRAAMACAIPPVTGACVAGAGKIVEGIGIIAIIAINALSESPEAPPASGQDAIDTITDGQEPTHTTEKGEKTTQHYPPISGGEADKKMDKIKNLPGAKTDTKQNERGSVTVVETKDGTKIIDRLGAGGVRTIETQSSDGTEKTKTRINN